MFCVEDDYKTQICIRCKFTGRYRAVTMNGGGGVGGWGFYLGTMSVGPGFSYRKQKENRTKRTNSYTAQYNSPPTNCIYPTT